MRLRWQPLRSKLLDQGADQASAAAVAVAVEEHLYQPGQYGLAIFANAGEVVLLETLSAAPAIDEALYGPLPHTMPLLAQRGEDVPYVRVLADRTGADLEGMSVGGVPRRRTVTGRTTTPTTTHR